MKIDTTKIEGYEAMSAEEKLAALTNFEIDVPKQDDAAIEKLKAAISKANADAASWKKQFREKQTEAERAEAERADAEAAMREELETLRRKDTVSGLVAQYMNTGYSQEMATRAAEAMVDGRTSDVISIQSEFLAAKQKELEAAALNQQPKLSIGTPPTAAQAEAEADNKLRSYFGLPPK